jgi:type II secretory pathway pseudopilin PulG
MQAGFTLVETLAAITLIMVAIVAPMGLTVQSLSVAYYARDQITASNLAQEGIEIVRSMRDANVLSTSEGTPFNIFCGGSPCGTLLTNGQLYGYNHGGNPGYSASNFTRSLYACYVQSGGGCNNTASDEVRLVVVVSWQTAAYRSQQITLTENLFNWVNPGSGV